MPASRFERRFDVVLFGATGFTGGLTADYLARHAPRDCRWAIAGRSPERLASVRDRLTAYDERLADLPLLAADSADPSGLVALTRQTRVLATTVGPFVEHGDPVVAACAATGTDYVDIAGEPEFVNRTYTAHHEESVRTQARLVHCCGFDSVPYDLGVQFTVEQLPGEVPIRVDGYVRAGGKPSAGTYHSAIIAFGRRRESRQAAADRRRVEARPADRNARAEPGRLHRAAAVNGWGVPLPTIDPQVVARSARALEEYGPDFRYRHFAAVRRLPTVVTSGAGMGAALLLAQLPATRRWLLGRMTSGEGPSESRRARSWFEATFVGSAAGQRVVTRVRGGDPGYDETAKMLAEAALCLVFDDLPPACGQVTPAVAMGPVLRQRLIDAGITFEVIEHPSG